MPERFDPVTNMKVQTFHVDITPQFLCGTQKDITIKDDPMYQNLYDQFDQRIHSSEIVLIVGYSFGDTHVNEKLNSAISKNLIKRIIHINPAINFPFDCIGVEIINLKSMNDLTQL